MERDSVIKINDKAILASSVLFASYEMPQVKKDINKYEFLKMLSIESTTSSFMEVAKEIALEVDALIWQWCLKYDDVPFADLTDFQTMFRNYCEALNEKAKELRC